MISRVTLIGLGDIASSHLHALEAVPAVEEVIGVDPRPDARHLFRGAEIEVLPEVSTAMERPSDLVVVATPTPSHAAVVREVRAAQPDVPVLVEKPVAYRRSDAEWMLTGPGEVEVIYHLGFAPEVLWAMELWMRERPRLGRVAAVHGWFGDPYAGSKTRVRSLGDSWADAGINGLSVAGRFVSSIEVTACRRLEGHSSTFEVTLDLRDGDRPARGSIFTTWQAVEPSRWTEVTFESGAALTMEHVAATATLSEEDRVVEFFAYRGPERRRDRHYANFYQDWFGPREHRYSQAESRSLHGALFQAVELLEEPTGGA
jgi:predicted dehydrogenase